MAKKKGINKPVKKKETRKKRGSYDDKVAVKGSFLDIVKAAVKNADKKSPKE